MIKLFPICMFMILMASCSQLMLVKYSVYSEQGEFNVLCGGSETIADKQWSHNTASGGDVFIYVIPKAPSQVLDVRVMYIANNGLEMYERVVSENPVLIKGKIRPWP